MPSTSRRTLLRAGAVGAAAGLAGCTTTVEHGQQYVDHDGWPMAAHDARNTGYNASATGPPDDPDLAWTVDTIPTRSEDVTLADTRKTTSPTPIVLGDTVYVGGEGLFAIDATDGTVRWHEFDAEMTFTPAAVDGTVYVASVTDDEVGHVRAVDPSDGSTIWTVTDETERELTRFGPIVVTETLAYVYLSENEWSAWPPDRTRLLAIDRSDGNHRWTTPAAVQRERASVPGVGDGTVYVGGPNDARIQAIGPSCGLRCRFLGGSPDSRWTSAEEVYYPMTALTVTDDRVLTGGWGHHWKAHSESPYSALTAFDRSDGSVRWRRRLGDRVTAPAVADGTSYVAATRSTGTEPYAGGEAVIIDSDVAVVSFEPDGTERWSRTLSDRQVWADPVVANDIVCVSTYTAQTADVPPTVHAFAAATGQLLWERTVPTRIASLAVAGDRLYGGGWDGTILALE